MTKFDEGPLAPKLRASRAGALAAKDAFQKMYVSDRTDRAVGIGLNRLQNAWAVKVYTKTKKAQVGLPTEFDGYEVDVEFTDKAYAQK